MEGAIRVTLPGVSLKVSGALKSYLLWLSYNKLRTISVMSM